MKNIGTINIKYDVYRMLLCTEPQTVGFALLDVLRNLRLHALFVNKAHLVRSL